MYFSVKQNNMYTALYFQRMKACSSESTVTKLVTHSLAFKTDTNTHPSS